MELYDKRYNEIRLIFHEEEHKYNDTFGNNYTSMTTLLHEYTPQFQKEYWLRKVSKEMHIDKEKLRKQWDDIKDEACARGSNTHNNLENGIKGVSKFKEAVQYLNLPNLNNTMITVADIPNININIKPLDIKEFKEATNNKYEKIYKLLEFYVENGFTIYSEIGVFDIDSLVSGTIDVLCLREDMFVIGDWKTNRGGLQFKSGYYKKDKTSKPYQLTNKFVETKEYLLPPLTHLPKCNGSIYNLQISGYGRLTEKILGIPCAGCWLCHIDSDFELNEYGMAKRFPDGLYHIKSSPVEKVSVYKMRYMKDEINMILSDRRKVVQADIVKNKDLFADEM